MTGKMKRDSRLRGNDREYDHCHLCEGRDPIKSEGGYNQTIDDLNRIPDQVRNDRRMKQDSRLRGNDRKMKQDS